MKQLVALTLLFVVCISMTGCRRGAGKAPPFPTPHVQVATPVTREITDFEEFTGRTTAKDSVNVIARATGYLVSADFKEGAIVKKGDLLFVIEPKPYQKLVDQAAAAVKQFEAQVAGAKADNARSLELIKTPGAISKQDVDRYETALEQATANLESAKAALVMAEINLGYCWTKAKIDGKVGNYLVTPGNVVTRDQTLLTTVVSQNPIYVDFDIDQRTFLRLQERDGKAKLAGSIPPEVTVTLGLTTDEGFPHEGTVNFTDNHVDPLTGTLRKRAQFPNPDLKMTPGLFARIRLPISLPHQALLIPENALGTEQERRFVYVVNSKSAGDKKDPAKKIDVVEQRVVKVGSLQGGLRVIEEGLTSNDRVVINPLPTLQMTIQQNKGQVVIDAPPPSSKEGSEPSKDAKPPVRPDQPAKPARSAMSEKEAAQ
ncbi:MAG: efflux RND transporter periplasmic adaptor subunit [Planctomycetes bacterium]|nr:efflux RND transporter periplasmic adaptor subunit [Planctomycetota bacterium]